PRSSGSAPTRPPTSRVTPWRWMVASSPHEGALMGLLDGQKAAITGAASGIGAATARRMVDEGAVVSVLDIDGEGAEKLVGELGGHAFQVDVTDTAEVEDVVDRAAHAMGGLTILVNNAGIGSLKPMHVYNEQQWDLLVNVNLKGVFNAIRAGVPL